MPKNRQRRELIVINNGEIHFWCVKMTHFLALYHRGNMQQDLSVEKDRERLSGCGHPQQQELLYFSHVLYSPTLQ